MRVMSIDTFEAAARRESAAADDYPTAYARAQAEARARGIQPHESGPDAYACPVCGAELTPDRARYSGSTNGCDTCRQRARVRTKEETMSKRFTCPIEGCMHETESLNGLRIHAARAHTPDQTLRVRVYCDEQVAALRHAPAPAEPHIAPEDFNADEPVPERACPECEPATAGEQAVASVSGLFADTPEGADALAQVAQRVDAMVDSPSLRSELITTRLRLVSALLVAEGVPLTARAAIEPELARIRELVGVA